MIIGNYQVYSNNFEKWESLNQEILELKSLYLNGEAKNFNKKNSKLTDTKKRYQTARKFYAGKLEKIVIKAKEISANMIIRAKVDQNNWKKPLLHAEKPDTRRIKIPKGNPDISKMATLIYGLATELEGITKYDLLCGEKDSNFDVVIARNRQKQKPGRTIFKFACALIQVSNQWMKIIKAKMKKNSLNPDQLFLQIQKNSQSLIQAAKLLKNVRELEPSLQASVKAAEDSVKSLTADYLVKHSRFEQIFNRAMGKLNFVETSWSNNDKEREKLKEALRQLSQKLKNNTIKKNLQDSLSFVNKGNYAKASDSSQKTVLILRRATRKVRTLIEQFNQLKRVDKPTQLSPFSPYDSRQMELMESCTLNAYHAINHYSRKDILYTLFKISITLDQAILNMKNGIGFELIKKMGINTNKKLWKIILQKKTSDTITSKEMHIENPAKRFNLSTLGRSKNIYRLWTSFT